HDADRGLGLWLLRERPLCPRAPCVRLLMFAQEQDPCLVSRSPPATIRTPPRSQIWAKLWANRRRLEADFSGGPRNVTIPESHWMTMTCDLPRTSTDLRGLMMWSG